MVELDPLRAVRVGAFANNGQHVRVSGPAVELLELLVQLSEEDFVRGKSLLAELLELAAGRSWPPRSFFDEAREVFQGRNGISGGDAEDRRVILVCEDESVGVPVDRAAKLVRQTAFAPVPQGDHKLCDRAAWHFQVAEADHGDDSLRSLVPRLPQQTLSQAKAVDESMPAWLVSRGDRQKR